jgi:H+/Cl- antiporter ClcA
MRAWRSWITGWKLIPRNAWLRTVGLLTGLKFLFAIAGQLVSAPLRANPTSNLNTILVFALMWLITTVVSLYFAFYAVAIWRRYTRLPEAAPIPEALRADLAHPLIDELDDPVTGKTDKDAGENG